MDVIRVLRKETIKKVTPMKPMLLTMSGLRNGNVESDRRGRVLLLGVIVLLLAVNLLNTIVLFSPAKIVSLLIGAILLWVMYSGYTWAKVLNILFLIFGVVSGFLEMSAGYGRGWMLVFFVVAICAYSLSGAILVFSKSIGEFMYAQRNG